MSKNQIDLSFLAEAVIKKHTILLQETTNTITGKKYIPAPFITTLHTIINGKTETEAIEIVRIIKNNYVNIVQKIRDKNPNSIILTLEEILSYKDMEGNLPLFSVMNQNKFKLLEVLIKELGVDPWQVNKDGFNLLDLHYENPKIVKLIFENSPKNKHQTIKRQRATKEQIENEQNKDKLKKIIDKKTTLPEAIMNSSDEEGVILLESVELVNKHSKLEISLNQITPGTQDDPGGSTALVVALHGGKINTAKWLITHGIDLNLSNNMKVTPLIMERIKNIGEIYNKQHLFKSNMTKLLLEYGANPNVLDNNDISPLARTIMLGDSSSTICLLDYGANPNIVFIDTAVNKLPTTPLVKALEMNNIFIAETLLAHKADPNPVGSNIQPLAQSLNLYIVSKDEPHFKLIRTLLAKGAAPDIIVDKFDNTLLTNAVTLGDLQLVMLSMDYGGNLYHLNRCGSVFHNAALNSYKEINKSTYTHIFNFLLDNFENKDLIDFYNNDQSTALHYAVIAKNEDIVRTLLGAGANPKAEDAIGNTALTIAIILNQENIIKLLREYGIGLEASNSYQISGSQLKNALQNLPPYLNEMDNLLKFITPQEESEESKQTEPDISEFLEDETFVNLLKACEILKENENPVEIKNHQLEKTIKMFKHTEGNTIQERLANVHNITHYMTKFIQEEVEANVEAQAEYIGEYSEYDYAP